MTTDIEKGRYLARLRDKVGLKQNELAEQSGLSASVLSRVESGERPVSADELQSIIKIIGSEEALQLPTSIGLEWRYLERPPLGHPDDSLLWEAEKALCGLGELESKPDITAPFAKRLEESKAEIVSAANLVFRTEHNIAFVGDIGVGKSTAICKVSSLEVQNERTGVFSPMLEVGAGGITVCEVHIVQGPDYGIVVEPKSENEIHREVREFATLLKNTPETDAKDGTSESELLGTSKEIERAIRNMSGLTRSVKRSVGSDGKTVRERVDPALNLAEASEDANTLALEVLAKMGLDKRTRRELWHPETSGKHPLAWLQETFNSVNNGRHPEFSIPNRIEILIPHSILESDPLAVRLVDTKGIDQTAIRSDLESHFNEPNTIVVLCSSFNSAPDPSIQGLLERAIEVQLANLEDKAAVLVLAKNEEALAEKDDLGISVETSEEGYELKGDKADLRLTAMGVPDIQVNFFNSREDDPAEFSTFLMGLISRVRDNHCGFLSEVIDGANALVQNYAEEQVRTTQRQAANILMAWITNNRELASPSMLVEDSLIQSIRTAHASSLHASVLREGDWYNLEYSPELEFGARRVAINAVNSKLASFKEVAESLRQTPDLKDAIGLVQQTTRILQSGVESLSHKSQILGRAIHTQSMRLSFQLWSSSENEWGQGYGYRDRVAKHHKNWFASNSSQDRLESLIETEWQQILSRMAAILETDE